ncbi:hypothetical protein PybrP1_002277 [[Pythium] brassicae (nom. inval.)]|nr:hypothetical protein PybrP1_002277 [[Pythium] brassicae (nom. inval.)]
MTHVEMTPNGALRPKENAARGELHYERVEGATTATHVFATYPLKFLHPRGAVRQGFDTFLTYVLGYGGGLVGGDAIDIECHVGADATVVLATQATTKVFKADGDGEFALQSFALTVASGATLAFLPDPVTCFERAKYRQRQVFHLAADANLVFVDWLTSGRKRNFVSTGAVRATRTEVHEHWDFSEYDNSAEIFVGGTLVLTDRVRLADEEDASLRERMYGTHVLGLLVVLGERVQAISALLLEMSKRKRLHNAQELTPQGRLPSQNGFPGVIASASPLGANGVLVRFCGETTEDAMHYVKTVLSGLRDVVGVTPYQDNR